MVHTSWSNLGEWPKQLGPRHFWEFRFLLTHISRKKDFPMETKKLDIRYQIRIRFLFFCLMWIGRTVAMIAPGVHGNCESRPPKPPSSLAGGSLISKTPVLISEGMAWPCSFFKHFPRRLSDFVLGFQIMKATLGAGIEWICAFLLGSWVWHPLFCTYIGANLSVGWDYAKRSWFMGTLSA